MNLSCRMMVFKNSNYQCFIPALAESKTSRSQSHPQPNARGDAKYRKHFPYFFSSTPGPLPSISFSHHANWQKLVPFALFIYFGRDSLSAWCHDVTKLTGGFIAGLFDFNALWWKNVKVKDESEGSLEMWFDLLMHIYGLNGAMTCEERKRRELLESKLKWE